MPPPITTSSGLRTSTRITIPRPACSTDRSITAVGRHDAFVRAHALEALRFDLSIALYLAVIGATLRTVGGGPYTMFTAMAARRAATGQLFTYPLTLRLPSLSGRRSSH